MSMLPTKQPTYKDGRTKQSFKDETDINKILQRAQKTGTISHINKYEARYGDFTGFDFFEAQLKLSQGREIFDALPSEIRDEFRQSPADFFKYVNDPANQGRVSELLPALAEPGRQNISTKGNLPADEVKADELAQKPAEAVVSPPAEKPAEPAPQPPPEASTPVT